MITVAVTVRYLTHFRQLTGRRKQTYFVPVGASLRELLEQMIATHGPALGRELFDAETGALRPRVLLLVDGLPLARLPDGLAHTLTDHTHLVLTRPISGG